jgi:hypothetical protein
VAALERRPGKEDQRLERGVGRTLTLFLASVTNHKCRFFLEWNADLLCTIIPDIVVLLHINQQVILFEEALTSLSCA